MSSDDLNSKTRFSDRVDDYVKYRPDYPREIVRMLRDRIELSPDWIIADIGCGTGISCRMFLENGNSVLGIEPNDAMRSAAETEFARLPGFRPVKGSAEATTLPEGAADLVLAAQAFHWFDREGFARESKRILRPAPGGYVLLMWNTRLIQSDPFAAEYDALLHRLGTDYAAVAHRSPITVGELGHLFVAPFERLALPNAQGFDFESLSGRVRSASYTPKPGEPAYDLLHRELWAIFERHQTNGTVRFNYETELYLGRVV